MANKGNIMILMFLLILVGGYGQSDKEKKANKAIFRSDYKAAASIYEQIVQAEPNNIIAKRNLVDVYLTLGDNESAEKWLSTLAYGNGVPPIYKFTYAQVLMARGKYAEAKQAYADFAIAAPSDSRAKFIKNNTDYIDKLLRISPQYTLTNLSVINTENSEMCAVNYGESLLYSSNKNTAGGKNYYDLYTSKKIGEASYDDPIRVKGNLNSSMHDGPVAINNNQNYIYVTRSWMRGGNCASGKDKVNHFCIYEGVLNEEKNEKLSLTNFSNEGYSVGHPTISVDGKTMIFSSNMAGGYGESDLYIVTKTEGGWGKPMNLGKDINTPGREVFPFLTSKGELYFSTDGRIGIGGLDIYKSIKIENKYTNITNLGMPLNSPEDDFGIFVEEEGKSGYISSNRKEGEGSDDIYAFTKMSKMSMEVTLFDAISKEELTNGQVEMFDLDRKTLTIQKTDDFGSARFELDENTSYKVKSKKEGFKAKEINFKTLSMNPEKQSVRIPLRKEGGIVLIVTIKDNEGNLLSDAAVTIEEEITKAKKTTKTNANGKASITILADRNYKILATKRVQDNSISYSVSSEKINTQNLITPYTMYASLSIEKFVEGTITEIPSIYYDVNSSGIRKDALMPIGKLVTILKKNPKLMIEIRSHTDSRGDDNINLNLSSTRASAMAEYIVGKGISAARITSKGYGETELKNSCGNGANCTEMEHQENRRTEFKILKVK